MNVDFRLIKIRILRFWRKIPDWGKSIIDFFRFIIEYGILISILLYGVFKIDIDIWRLLGLGILYYFIMYELPEFLNRLRSR